MGGATYEAAILEANQAVKDADTSPASLVCSFLWRIRVLHFQLQVTIGSYGYEPAEMYFVHGVLLLLAIVVVHWVLMQVKAMVGLLAGWADAFCLM